MNLILFIHQDSPETGETFKKIIMQKFNVTEIHTIETLNTFKAKLKKPTHYNNEVYILFIDSCQRLKELKSLVDLLDGKQLIMVLPDDSKSTLSLAHQFFPRYFTIINETYDDLCAVLSKISDKISGKISDKIKADKT